MTVSTTTNKIRYSGTGSQYIFAYTFKIFADADLEVILTDTSGVDTVQTLTTHYSVSGAGDESGGNVTMITAPASGEYLTVKRDLDILQETDYVENDSFPAESHENALDRLTMICQQLNEAIDRSLKISVGSGVSGITFPPLVSGEYVKVNSAGDGLETTALLATLGSEAAAVATANAYTDTTIQDEIKPYTTKFENLNINNTAVATSFVITADRMRLTDVSGNVMNISAVSETCDVTGTGANGRASIATGSDSDVTIATGSTYFLFIIAKADGTVNSFLDDTATPSLPTGYTYWCLIWAGVSIATNTFNNFTQKDDKVCWVSNAQIITSGAATTATAIAATDYVPASTYVYSIDIITYCIAASATIATVYVSSIDGGLIIIFAAGVGAAPSGQYSYGIVYGEIPVDPGETNPTIYYYLTGSGATTHINVTGYRLKI